MKIKKYKTEFGKSYSLIENNKTLQIFFGGNLDLYWRLSNLYETDPLYDTFTITKENYFIYDLFDTLYNDIANYDIYDEKDYNNNVSQLLENINKYTKLFNNDTITWVSDDRDLAYLNILRIAKKDGTYLLEFAKMRNEKCNEPSLLRQTTSIRFRNSGSYYRPFNTVFMKMYNKLCTYNPEYHQEHIEEYLYKLTKKY